MLTNRLQRRTARISSRGGFTLVELLVVIGIIAILAGVALGPITSGIKKAQQSTGMQTARTISLSEFSFANDNGGSYPDTANPTGNTGSGAAAVALPLLLGNYISDATIFYLSGSSATKYTGSTPTTALTATNISWDFCGNNGAGVNSNFPDACPVIWSSVKGGTEPTLAGSTAGTVVTATPIAGNAFGVDGMAVGFKSNSSKFVTSQGAAGSKTCTLIDLTNPGLPANAGVLQGGG